MSGSVGVSSAGKHRSLTVAAPFGAFNLRVHSIDEYARHRAATVRERCFALKEVLSDEE
jgi:hypothetical protein